VKIRRPPRSRTGQGSRRRDSNSTCDATSVVCATRHPHGATDRQDHGAGWVNPTTASGDAIGGA
jgi:hypothetical protein